MMTSSSRTGAPGAALILLCAFAAHGLAAGLQLLRPNEQDLTIERGAKYDIRWTSDLPRDARVRVSLLDSQGGEWELAVVKGATHWPWQAGKWRSPQAVYPNGVGYRVRIAALDGGAEGVSEHPFAIGTPVSIGITGPLQAVQQSVAQYHCMAQYDAGTTADVTAAAKWKLSSPFARIDKSGRLTTRPVASDQPCTISATYGKGRSAASAEYDITITREPPTTSTTTSSTTTLPPTTTSTTSTTTLPPATTTSTTSSSTTLPPSTTTTTSSTTTSSTTTTLPPTTSTTASSTTTMPSTTTTSTTSTTASTTTTTAPPDTTTSTTSSTTTLPPTTTTSTTTSTSATTSTTTVSTTTSTTSTSTSTTTTAAPSTTTSSTVSTTTSSTTTTTLPPTLTIEAVSIFDPPSGSVPQYAKLELLITLANVAATKPYDPDPASGGLDLSATFISPGATEWSVNGFYDGAQWLVRFAPDEVGAWSFSVRAEDASGVATWNAGAFACAASGNPGWPRVSGRYLAPANGPSSLAVGHNTGWQYDPEQPPLADMAAQQEDLLSFWLAVPWAQPGWTSPEEPWWGSRSAIENAEGGIGNYNQSACAYVDGVVARAEEAGVRLLPTIWSHGQLRDTGHPWGLGWWSNNAYASLCSATEFFQTASAEGDTPQWRYQKNYLRYLVARWGYSRAIAGWVLLCEIDGTTGYVQNRAQTEAWCATAASHMRGLDPFRRNGSDQYPIAATKVDQPSWNSGLDMRSVDSYQRKDDDIAVAATIASQTATLRSAGRPAFHAEFGGDAQYGATQPAHLHSGIWAGVMAGAALTPLVWCDGGDYTMLTAEMSNHLRYLAEFTAPLDYLSDGSGSPVAPALDAPSCRAWGIAGDGRACTWVQNTSGTIGGQTLTLSGMADGSYDVTWYDVWTSGSTPMATETVPSAAGALQLVLPTLTRPDIACRIEPAAAPVARLVEPAACPGLDEVAPSRPGAEESALGTARREPLGRTTRSTATAAHPNPMTFSRDGLNGRIAAAVARVAGEARVQVATVQRGPARSACIVIDSDRRAYGLDRALPADSLAALAAAGFSPASDPASRTMSIFRSVARQAMQYQPDRGDELLILLCPRDAWPQLDLQWPP